MRRKGSIEWLLEHIYEGAARDGLEYIEAFPKNVKQRITNCTETAVYAAMKQNEGGPEKTVRENSVVAFFCVLYFRLLKCRITNLSMYLFYRCPASAFI